MKGERAVGALLFLSFLPLSLVFLGECVSSCLAIAGFMTTPENLLFGTSCALAHGEGIYLARHLTTPPFLLCPYMPLYPLLVALPNKFFPSPFWGKALSILSVALASWFIVKILEATGVRKPWRFLGPLIWLGAVPVLDWGPAHTEDCLATALDLGVLWAGLRGREGLAGGFLFLGLLTRPTAVCGALAVMSEGLVRRIKALGAGLGGFVGVMALLAWLTRGGILLHLRLLSAPLTITTCLAVLLSTLRLHPAVGYWSPVHPAGIGGWWIIALATLGYVLSRGGRRGLKVFALSALGIGLLTSLRWGASTDYFLPFVAGCALCLPPFLSGMRRQRLVIWGAVLSAAGLADVIMWGPAHLLSRPWLWRREARQAFLAVIDAQNYWHTSPGDWVLSVDPSYALRFGRRSLVNEPWTFSVMALWKGWDWGKVERWVKGGRVKLALLRAPGVPPENCYARPWRDLANWIRGHWRKVRSCNLIDLKRGPFEVEVYVPPEQGSGGNERGR